MGKGVAARKKNSEKGKEKDEKIEKEGSP